MIFSADRSSSNGKKHLPCELVGASFISVKNNSLKWWNWTYMTLLVEIAHKPTHQNSNNYKSELENHVTKREVRHWKSSVKNTASITILFPYCQWAESVNDDNYYIPEYPLKTTLQFRFTMLINY